MNNTNIDQWIEKFYSDLENGSNKNYIRPSDYRERALRILNGIRKPVRHQSEGKRGSIDYEDNR